MARALPNNPVLLITISILLSSILSSTLGEKIDGDFKRPINRKKLGLIKEKLTHFRVYWHDISSGKNPTSIPVVQPPDNSSSTFFGQINMIDNPLTESTSLSSKLVGKAQGFYSLASQEELSVLMAMNLVFIGGKYNGSTIVVVGRNAVLNKVREMPVIGGSGLFRFARGYVQAKTYKFDLNTKDATVEYNIYVLHY